MMRIPFGHLGVERGSRILFSDVEDGGPMWTGEGPRERRHHVAFSEPFLAPPVVTVSLGMWDLDHATNARVDLTAEEIGRDGFVVVFRTWGDTRVARIRADWLAIGPLRDDEAWEID
jgi:hypothetical protein